MTRRGEKGSYIAMWADFLRRRREYAGGPLQRAARFRQSVSMEMHMQRESTSGQNASTGQERQQGGQERQQQAEQSYAGQQGGSNQQQGTQTRGSQGEMATRGGSQGQGVQVGQRGG